MKTEMLLLIPPAMVLLMIARIVWLVLSKSASRERKTGGLINLGFLLFYSALCWIPVLTYEEQYSDLPSIDIGPILFMVLWFLILFFHSLIYLIILEVKTYHRIKTIHRTNQYLQS